MLRNLRPLLGYKLYGFDGLGGTLHDIYFNDASWRARHFVVHLGHRIFGHNVLMDPRDIGEVDWVHERIVTPLSREQMAERPRCDSEKPVFKQMEEGVVSLAEWVAHLAPWAREPELQADSGFIGNPHLRSVRHLCGYTVTGPEGELGRVSDFIADDSAWDIKLLEVETARSAPGGGPWYAPEAPAIAVEPGGRSCVCRVVVPREVVREFVKEYRRIETNVDDESFALAPEFNPLLWKNSQRLEQLQETFAYLAPAESVKR